MSDKWYLCMNCNHTLVVKENKLDDGVSCPKCGNSAVKPTKPTCWQRFVRWMNESPEPSSTSRSGGG